ncbi:MAG: hypothetical protein CME62_17950 [Halobacteriovoraceae bacterium]|nr:hypothetical protein [Halobacteriovoraceae bacterium]|tara:strand:+ start:21650 stop:23029 length:1380 start_codon:yes stop_codon:yes gene_type:complete
MEYLDAKERIQLLNDKKLDRKGDIFYVCELAPRYKYNPALVHAIQWANEHSRKLIVLAYVSKNKQPIRHLIFRLEALRELEEKLKTKNIKLVVRKGKYLTQINKHLEGAAGVVIEKGYLNEHTKKINKLKKKFSGPIIEAETSLVVPAHIVSDKREYAARTFRPKIEECYQDFIQKIRTPAIKSSSLNAKIKSDVDLSKKNKKILSSLGYKKPSQNYKKQFQGGYKEARKKLKSFIKDKLDDYADNRQNVLHDAGHSNLSAYLAKGHISPIEVIRKIERAKGAKHKGRKAFIEELLVRRELAYNFVSFENHYDQFNTLPEWAYETLKKHKSDERKSIYTESDFEQAKTDDQLWNLCMRHMKKFGYLHNALRMYWGKKIIQCTNTPAHGFKVALELNNKYFLDGRNPNSYANILWCFGLHDRAWGESQVFGKVRTYSQENAMGKLGGEEGLDHFEQQLSH